MLGFNTLNTNASARDIADELLGKRRATPLHAPPPENLKPLSYDDETGTTASERALANIIATIYRQEALEAEADAPEASADVAEDAAVPAEPADDRKAAMLASSREKPVEVTFARGDGEEALTADGPIDIRLAFASAYRATGSTSPFAPKELEITVSESRLVVRSQVSEDMVAVAFSAGALEHAVPQVAFDKDQGDYVMKVR